MSTRYLTMPDPLVKVETLRLPKAQAVARYLLRGERTFARLVTTLRDELGEHETVVMEVEVQRPQWVVHPIHHVERIAVRFSREDETWPEVYALREDFPDDVPHLNLTTEGSPRSLCLYDTLYDDGKLQWTAPTYVERIRQWLADTAMGTLHAPDQPLEPLLLPAVPYLIVPHDLLQAHGALDTDADAADHSATTSASGLASDLGLAQNLAKSDGVVPLYQVEDLSFGLGRPVYKLIREAPSTPSPGKREQTRQQGQESTAAPMNVALVLQGAAQTHGVIAHQPRTLRELHAFLLSANIDLLSHLRTALRAWRPDESLLARIIIISVLPTRRSDRSAAEITNIWAFSLDSTIEDLGERVGVWRARAGVIILGAGQLPMPIDPNKLDPLCDGHDVRIVTLNPVVTLFRESAARLNGLPAAAAPQIVAIGAGALGSQTFANLIRAGFGGWTLVDRDHLLPHNRARHAVFSGGDGIPKALLMAVLANQTFDERPIARSIVADVLHPGEQAGALTDAYASADVILDMSASGAVARFLARDVASAGRRASFFVTPSGADAVLLMEDKSRATPLDALEMQYYRYLVQNQEWCEHLRQPTGSQRYGRSCRDVSSDIPQDLIALHAANGSRVLRDATAQPGARIQLWHAEPDGSVRVSQTTPAPAVSIQVQGWTIITDAAFLAQVRATRLTRLPNETGGMLIGAWDTARRLIYVVDALPSPSDSLETPRSYVRGDAGMPTELCRIEQATGGMAQYIGEWHSHPPGHDSRPSRTDYEAFDALRAMRHADGLPILLLIVGRREQTTWLVDGADSI